MRPRKNASLTTNWLSGPGHSPQFSGTSSATTTTGSIIYLVESQATRVTTDQDFMYNFAETSLPSLFTMVAISFHDSTTGRITLKVPLKKTHTLNHRQLMFAISNLTDTHMEHDTQNV